MPAIPCREVRGRGACALAGSVLLLALLVPRPAFAEGEDPLQALLDREVPGLLSRDRVPGLAVAVVRNGAVAWSRGYGVADVRTGAPVTPQHVFWHGSDAKPLTAWGVLRLVEEGRLELDVPVEQYLRRWHLPSAEHEPRLITLRQLLSHTAGLERDPSVLVHPRRRLPTVEQVLAGEILGTEPVRIRWKPGTEVHYSNSAFGVAELVMEEVTGEPFAQYMQRAILAPLGMRHSSYGWTPALQAEGARPYDDRGAPLPYYHLVPQSSGAIVATVPDFARFVAAMMAGPQGEPPGRGVLRPESVAELMTPQPATGGEVGLGFGLATLSNGLRVIGNQGTSMGWYACFMAQPERRLGIVVAANSDRAFLLCNDVLGFWQRAELGLDAPTAPEPRRIEVDEPVWLFLVPAWALVLGAVLWAWRLQAQVRAGRRRWQPSVRAVAVGWLALLAGVAWLLWAYGPLPSPLLVDFLPRELGWLTVAVLAWVCISVVAALLPRRPA